MKTFHCDAVPSPDKSPSCAQQELELLVVQFSERYHGLAVSFGYVGNYILNRPEIPLEERDQRCWSLYVNDGKTRSRYGMLETHELPLLLARVQHGDFDRWLSKNYNFNVLPLFHPREVVLLVSTGGLSVSQWSDGAVDVACAKEMSHTQQIILLAHRIAVLEAEAEESAKKRVDSTHPSQSY